MPSLSASNLCGSDPTTLKFFFEISLQSKSGGGDGIQTSGYEGSQSGVGSGSGGVGSGPGVGSGSLTVSHPIPSPSTNIP